MFKAKKDGDRKVLGSKMLSDDDLKEFEEVNRFFVDSFGWGQEGELAMTIKQFLKEVKVDKYYAIIEVRLFQVYVGEYIKKG